MSLVSIIIPVFNSSNSLIELEARISALFLDLKYDYEIIFVNDASSAPSTAETLKSLDLKNRVTINHHSTNKGKTKALLTGITTSSGEFIITMDDDLQHRPEDIVLLLNEKNHDVVIAKYTRQHDTILNRMGSHFKNYLDWIICNKPLAIRSGPFKLIRRHVALQIIDIPIERPLMSSLLYYVTNDIVNVSVSHKKRVNGNSNFSFRQRVTMIGQLLWYNSTWRITYCLKNRK